MCPAPAEGAGEHRPLPEAHRTTGVPNPRMLTGPDRTQASTGATLPAADPARGTLRPYLATKNVLVDLAGNGSEGSAVQG